MLYLRNDSLTEKEDDEIRLVYADWLEDSGDPRAEFIRLQMNGGDPLRIQELLNLHRSKWSRDDKLPELITYSYFHKDNVRFRFRKGFAEVAEVDGFRSMIGNERRLKEEIITYFAESINTALKGTFIKHLDTVCTMSQLESVSNHFSLHGQVRIIYNGEKVRSMRLDLRHSDLQQNNLELNRALSILIQDIMNFPRLESLEIVGAPNLISINGARSSDKVLRSRWQARLAELDRQSFSR